jgi:hypothetical protein
MQMRMEISQSAGELDWEKTIRCAREDFCCCLDFLFPFERSTENNKKSTTGKITNEENRIDFFIQTLRQDLQAPFSCCNNPTEKLNQ